ncbi:MAG TPA: aminotransferase class I/II-fold pyridoxal phosphate-dependent enzyme [Propylenella sp.]|nr:aminotransferase class I/II-fold pyridoxal phosphate-dependent enzyme [Propylenella sp.]
MSLIVEDGLAAFQSAAAPGDWPHWPRVDRDRALATIGQVLDGRIWTIRAPGDRPCLTERAEQQLARLFGAKYAFLVSSGTVAVELAVRALRLPPDAEVVVPGFGWFATAAAVRRAGARPVFADVDPETSCLDPAAVSSALSPRTAAIVAVHLHCALAEMDRLMEIADRHDLPLIEDCAQAHGAMYAHRPIGTFGRIGCFSFNQEKLIAVGEGGCVITDDAELAGYLHALRTDGYLSPPGPVREFVSHGGIMGGNGCCSEFTAALLLSQLEDFSRLDGLRRAHGAALVQHLGDVEGVVPLATAPNTTRRVWHEFAMLVDPAAFGEADIDAIGDWLTDVLGFPVHRSDEPTNVSPLLAFSEAVAPCPNAHLLYDRLLVFHHRMLLDPRIVDAVPDGFERLRRRAGAGAGVVPEAGERP